MAADSQLRAYLGLQDHTLEKKVLESDSDSGQGSSEMTARDQREGMESLDDADSDDEILVIKKSKKKKVFEESDSEEDICPATCSTGLTPESDEDDKGKRTTERGKPQRIRSTLLDSDDSDKESVGDLVINYDAVDIGEPTFDKDSPHKNKSVGKQKRNAFSKKTIDVVIDECKSKRRTEKKKMGSIGNIKNDIQQKSTEVPRCEEEFEEHITKSEKKERKASRMGKEAIKQMHSETQRLLRESAVSLPYHLPEPKTIHDFFKRRSRPVCEGNAMQLIKSSKYLQFSTEDRMETEAQSTELTACDSVPTPECKMDLEVDVQNTQVSRSAALNESVAETSGECQPADNLEHEISTGNSEITSEPSSIDCSGQTVCHQENEKCIKKVTNEISKDIPEPEVKSATCEHSQTIGKSCSNSAPKQAKPKLSKLEKLRALGVNLSVKPRLCPDDGSFVNLEDPKPNKDLEALKERFLKHSLHKVKAVTERKVNLNIVRKETTADGKQELKADVVPVTVDVENHDERVHGKPGEKLQVLKAKLQEAMKLRRIEERQKRQALFNLDNEDGYEDEEEEDMTDDSEDEDNAETLVYHLGEDGNKEDEPKDEELEESGITEVIVSVPRPVASESTLMLFKDNSTKMGDSIPDKMEHEEGCKESDKLAEEDDFLLPLTKDHSHNSSFELIGSMIPSYQPFSRTGRGLLPGVSGFRSPSPVHFKANFLSSASKSSGKMSEPSLPVEDSQDLYNASPEPKASYLCAGVDSQFQFSLEDDTQSQLLDADGFLNVGHNRSKYSSAKQRLVLDSMDENAMDANMGELLDLCSGQFKGSLSGSSQPEENEAKKVAMDELLELCSGNFVSQADDLTHDDSASVSACPETEKEDLLSDAAALGSGSFHINSENEEEEEFGDFQLLPCDESDSEEEEEKSEASGQEEENEDLVDDEEEILRKVHGIKRKLKLQDFMEDEAELSGSDIESGDEDEGDDNEYEEEAIDEDLPSDEELQDQVNKIHMKVTMDEDKRQLRLYQERYLAHGDLHSDGPGRLRKFRWKNFDDASQLDMFRRDSELEDQEAENEEMDETDSKWRKERFEREQWLREQSQSGNVNKEEEEEIGEDSQFMKLAKKVTEKVLQRRATVETSEPKKPVCKNPFEVNRPFSLPKMKTGSLLNKPKEVLQKLATISNLNPNAPRNSRNFVFRTLSPQRTVSTEKPKSKVRGDICIATPSPKRLKSDNYTTNSKNRSIFPFLEN
ncbi:claspin isoform X2 [Mixophyes fleayi]|uniref:claspin isoform X2 n=1 Tax=Mixophyes fleayi TaxID=3061075 RepID=UPI003F4DA2CB